MVVFTDGLQTCPRKLTSNLRAFQRFPHTFVVWLGPPSTNAAILQQLPPTIRRTAKILRPPANEVSSVVDEIVRELPPRLAASPRPLHFGYAKPGGNPVQAVARIVSSRATTVRPSVASTNAESLRLVSSAPIELVPGDNDLRLTIAVDTSTPAGLWMGRIDLWPAEAADSIETEGALAGFDFQVIASSFWIPPGVVRVLWVLVAVSVVASIGGALLLVTRARPATAITAPVADSPESAESTPPLQPALVTRREAPDEIDEASTRQGQRVEARIRQVKGQIQSLEQELEELTSRREDLARAGKPRSK